jgi:predicted MFS family arabinose efflux permease
MLQNLLARARSGNFDLTLMVPLLLNTAAVQVVISITRVTTSYRAVELALPVVWIGVISAAYSIIPLSLAVWVGRFIDRGHDAVATWIGGALLVVACSGFLLWPSAAGLFVCTALLGLAQLFLIAGQQMVCMRCAAPARFEQSFGNYMVANALGQGLGPYIVGWAGGGGTVPPTRLLFMLSLVTAVLVLIFALAMRPRPPDEHQQDGAAGEVAVGGLLRTPGLLALIVLGVIAVSSQDLIVVYLPLFGTERGIEVADIGTLLTIRAVASVVSRFLYVRIVAAVGRQRLMIASSLTGALAFVALAIPSPLVVMALATAVIGFSIGLATTLTVTGVVSMFAAGARATANSLRMMGNRLGQMVFPIGAGVVATAAGVGGVFIIIAACLIASAVAVHTRPAKRA